MCLRLQVSAAETGTVVASFDSLSISVSQPIKLLPNQDNQPVTLQLSVPESLITLWWPTRFGPQQLYTLRVTYTPSAAHIQCRAVVGGQDQGMSGGINVAEAAVSPGTAEELDARVAQKRIDDVQVAQTCIKAAQSVLTRRVGFR